MERKTIQEMYIRVCRDSNFTLPTERAAQFTAAVLKCDPLEVWLAMPSWGVMESIAVGNHGATRR